MEKITIYCENDTKEYIFERGTTLKEVRDTIFPQGGAFLAALVDNMLKELEYEVLASSSVRFIGYEHPDGRRTYVRSLCFVLQNAVSKMFPDKVLAIDYSLPSGLYCELREQKSHPDGRPEIFFLTDEAIASIKEKMDDMVAADLPFHKTKMTFEQASPYYEKKHQNEKIRLMKSLGRYSYSTYILDGQVDTFYGPLVPSTGCLTTFDLCGFNEGFCLQYPMLGQSDKVEKMKRQSKIATALKSHSDWCALMGIQGVGTLNDVVKHSRMTELVNLCEALHERKYAEIADKIYERRSEVKIVFIAGPSSSGKTSSSKRLAIQCRILGLNPKVIELDNYFVDRERTPKDEQGNYDFESLYAMDLDFLGKQLNQLLEGKEIEIPKFNFKEGKRSFEGNFMKLEEKDILIMEGIHALNPAMIPNVDNSRVFRVYASALTSLSIDENNNISTSDNRLLRRIIRDNRTRGIVPEETIIRWSSVRRGENRNIFPFQENADAVFNSAHLFELPVLKYYAEPLLRQIAPNSPAYPEATRLLKFLGYIATPSRDDIEVIPPTSIMREFIGGQTL